MVIELIKRDYSAVFAFHWKLAAGSPGISAGGEFHEARDANAVSAVYRQIDALQKTGFEKPRYVIEDRFLPFLIAAIALLLLGRLLESTVLGVFP